MQQIQRRRSELRLVISSATIDAKTMSAFFSARFDLFISGLLSTFSRIFSESVHLLFFLILQFSTSKKHQGSEAKDDKLNMTPAILSVEVSNVIRCKF